MRVEFEQGEAASCGREVTKRVKSLQCGRAVMEENKAGEMKMRNNGTRRKPAVLVRVIEAVKVGGMKA